MTLLAASSAARHLCTEAGPFGSEQPFVPVGREKVDVHRRHVHRQDAECLDGINAKKNSALPAELSRCRDVVPLPAGELRVRQRHHPGLGVVLSDAGKFEEARARYERALAIKPDLAEAHFNLANSFREQSKLDDAVAL